MTDLRTPNEGRNISHIPVVVFKNGEEVIELGSFKQAFNHLRPTVTCGSTELRNAIADGVAEFTPWYHNGDKYEFRTNERRRLEFVEMRAEQRKGKRP